MIPNYKLPILFSMVAVLACACLGASADDNVSSDSASIGPVPLKGSVTKIDLQAEDGNHSKPQEGKVDINSADRKIRKGKLTRDDYRKLQFGITGFTSQRNLLERFPVVIEVIPGCPAEQAGIRLGDRVMKANDHTFTRRDMQAEYWQIMDGKAGTNVDITVRRHRHELTLTLTRMNIEDIPSDSIRKRYERMVRKLGTPNMEEGSTVPE